MSKALELKAANADKGLVNVCVRSALPFPGALSYMCVCV